MSLRGENIVVTAGARRILDDVSIVVPAGFVVAVIGPNGAGKSTLLKVLSGDIVPQAGCVTLNGRPLASWSGDALARQRAVLPQSPELAFSFRAWDVVELGRFPHRGRASSDADRAAVRGAMAATETSALAGRDCRTLSGGELHRTHYARTLAQVWDAAPDAGARYLLLDEPTSSLDLFHQHAILAKARDVAQAGAGILAILHDLNLAAAYADRLVVLANGRVDAEGRPQDVLTAERVARVWRVGCSIIPSANGGVQILVAPRPREPA
ncbi:MAG: heme ABC transporter ATP-binding protein [Rhizomicrobium sp.]